MKNRLFYKLFSSTAMCLLVCLIFLIALLSFSVSNFFAKEKETVLTDNCVAISKYLTNELKQNNHLSKNTLYLTKIAAQSISSEIYVCDSTGRVLMCSCTEWENSKDCSHSQGLIPQEYLNDAKDGNYFGVNDFKGKYNKTYYTAGVPFYSDEMVIVGYVFASTPTFFLTELWDNLSKIFMFSSIIPVVLLFISIYATTMRLTKPLHLMSESASKISVGDYSMKIPSDGDTEIADLAKAFNSMSDSLSQLETMRRSFIANVSHELRTPMTTIGGFIDGIIDGTIPKEKHREYLQIVSGEIKRLSRLVQSMLSLARLESGEQSINVSNFDVFDLLCTIVLSQEKNIEDKNINIEGLESINKTFVSADRDLIYQVIYNLFDNAIKFTPENGTISFKIINNGKTRLIIRNSGMGIKPEDLRYIFDRFYKVDKSRSINKDGTGLGLYIAKTIMDIHKGKIYVRSQYGEYAEFEIEL